MLKQKFAPALAVLTLACSWWLYAQLPAPKPDKDEARGDNDAAGPVIAEPAEFSDDIAIPEAPAQPIAPARATSPASTAQPIAPARAAIPAPPAQQNLPNPTVRRTDSSPRASGGSAFRRSPSAMAQAGLPSLANPQPRYPVSAEELPPGQGWASAGQPSLASQTGAMIEADGRFFRMTTKSRTVLYSHAEEITAEERGRYEQFVENVRKLRKADATDEDRKAARRAVEELVSVELERDLAQREKQLAEIETKAKQLREQLEKRRGSKTELLNMNMMMIENPSGGFGLPVEWMQSLMPSAQSGQNISNLLGSPALPPASAGPVPRESLLDRNFPTDNRDDLRRAR